VIAPAVADDLGAPVDDPRAQLVAASLTATFNLLAERKTSQGEAWTAEAVAQHMDPLITFPRGGMAALQASRKTQRR
jgi:hypothetical protein